jgi:hypothetical protein
MDLLGAHLSRYNCDYVYVFLIHVTTERGRVMGEGKVPLPAEELEPLAITGSISEDVC